MKLGRITASWLVMGVLTGAPSPTSAEDIILKDGQKIVGTIIGYENDMFRVKTDYGIALVRKDKVASIQVSKPDATKPDASKLDATKLDATKLDATKPDASKPVGEKPALVTEAPKPHPASAPSAETPAKPPEPPPPPVSHPLDVPMPAHLQDHVDGNTYFSDTFQFSMFKPPDWKIYEGVPKEAGSGIMAMGTEDEQTLLIVDRQVWSGTPKLTSDQVEAKLRQTYQEFQRISEDAFECDGQAATRRTFTGVLDGAEWHGVAVHVIHGNTVFGITGLTSAENFQFQEAIFKKITKTFHFLTPPAPSPALPIANPAP